MTPISTKAKDWLTSTVAAVSEEYLTRFNAEPTVWIVSEHRLTLIKYGSIALELPATGLFVTLT